MKPFHPYILVAMSCAITAIPPAASIRGMVVMVAIPKPHAIPSLAGCQFLAGCQSRDLCGAQIIHFLTWSPDGLLPCDPRQGEASFLLPCNIIPPLRVIVPIPWNIVLPRRILRRGLHIRLWYVRGYAFSLFLMPS